MTVLLTERPEENLLEPRVRRGESRAVTANRNGEEGAEGDVAP